MMNVFVIIVTFNGMQWYEKCFSSLRRSTIPIKTIVVDNASTDGTIDFIRNKFPEIILIESKENLGFGKGNNLAMRYAIEHSCDYVFLINQDTWIDPDTIERLINIHRCHTEFGILSPIHLNADRTEIVAQIGLGNGFRNDKFLSDLYCNKLKELYPTNYVNAAAWLLPRKTLEIVGGFDPIFVHYEEDDNYINRVIYHKLKIGICPFVQIVHDHKDSALSNEKILIRRHQNLLVEWTNINKPFSFMRYFLHYLKKCVSALLTYNSVKQNVSFDELLYLIKNRKGIINSRLQSSKNSPSWL